MTGLKARLRQGDDLETIALYLDELEDGRRPVELRSLGRKEIHRLWELAEQAEPISDEHFVPAGHEPLNPVTHEGWNSLPMLPAFRRFQKVFCRPEDGSSDRLYGYNEGSARPLIGPGYFVNVPTAGRPEHEERGAWVIDYFQVPEDRVTEGWPTVVPNQKGLQRFVYNGTRDFMRRVSAHVSIGAAFKGERPLDHYFVLCRR